MNIVINPVYSHLKTFVNEIPSSFSLNEQSIYEGRNVLKLFETKGIKITVKSFRIPHFINRLAYTYFRGSKAKRSYENGLEIIKRGFDTPSPIAYIEEFKSGLLSRSYYICEYCDFAHSFREFDLRPRTFMNETDVLVAFADFTADMHEAELYHHDYSNGNILFEKKEDHIYFSLIDINRMSLGKVDENAGFKAFHRLCAGEEMLRIIAERYAIRRGFDIETCIKMVKKYNDKTMKPTPLEEWPSLEEKGPGCY